MSFTVHTPDSAPDAAREVLTGAKRGYGFVPNLLGVMANAPALLKAYTIVSKLFDETSLTPTERQIVLLSVSERNGCEYCVAAHSAIAAMQKVPAEVVAAIRQRRPIADVRLEALRRFTETVVATRGQPTEADITALVRAGYAREQVFEVILGVGLKTLSNYTNHVAETPLDQAFASTKWSKAA